MRSDCALFDEVKDRPLRGRRQLTRPQSRVIMTTFQSINVGLGLKDYTNEVTTPTTPRASGLISLSAPPVSIPSTPTSAPTTPTTLSAGGMDGQKSLPGASFSTSFSSEPPVTKQVEPGNSDRRSSHQSMQSIGSQDIEMDDENDDEGNSDAESVDGEPGRPSKKKKGLRFFCTDYPPCSLSFTRSEHLARHIRYVAALVHPSNSIDVSRKHTGERPFQCHCLRRFSRLDNLRQHAQTVHVNEEIPGDSLAATGTRFQRQIRTDRVRTPTGRSRASTASSQGSQSRGHSRNLSASSIGSTSSTISRDDSRRRPQPLMMASDSGCRSRLTLDTSRAQASTPPMQFGQSRDSSDGISTPTSTTFSNGPNSPGHGSSLGSPMSTMSRNSGLWASRTYGTHGRRLSVPSGPNPFQSPPGHSYPPPYISTLAPSDPSNFSNSSSVYGSPTASTYGFSRRDSAVAAEAERRRRTWHPTTYTNYSRPATSGLSYYQTPDAPRPAFAPQAATAASQLHRLPGIETFDQISHAPPTPPQGVPSPMQVDRPGRPLHYLGLSEQAISGPNDRWGHASWDKSLHQNLTRLDIANGAPSKDVGVRGHPTVAETQDAGARPPEIQRYPIHQTSPPFVHPESQKRPAESMYLQPVTPIKAKRQGWYQGPPKSSHAAVLQPRPRISPEDSSSSEGLPTPSFSAVEYHPAIIHSNGYIESHHVGNRVGSNHVRSSHVPDVTQANWAGHRISAPVTHHRFHPSMGRSRMLHHTSPTAVT